MSHKYNGLMNNTKWKEIRDAMYDCPYVTKWRIKNLENGYICDWDYDWFYHFRIGGYNTIEWLEIIPENDENSQEIIKILKQIHVPGEVLKDSIKVYGYKPEGVADYL